MKLGKMVTQVEEPQSTKSHASLIVWVRDVTWQNRNVISSFPQDM